MRDELITALNTHQSTFGIELSEAAIVRLADYYELVMEHNPLLHLVGPCTPEEFATRHILESLTLLKYLPERAKFADIGPGAGLPSIPCLLVREDLRAVLIESKVKKSGFLQIALAKCELNERAEIIAKQFSETPRPGVSYVTCRALDKLTAKLPQLIRWSGNCTLLIFGGPLLKESLSKCAIAVDEILLPMSTQRFLYVDKRI